MTNILRFFVLSLALVPIVVCAQAPVTSEGGSLTKTTFVRLTNNANAIIVEPVDAEPNEEPHRGARDAPRGTPTTSTTLSARASKRGLPE